MEQQALSLVAETTANELGTAGWIPKTPSFLDNDVVFLPASKDKISILFQANVRLECQALVQPSVSMHRDPTMTRNGCVDFVWADVPIGDESTITSDGIASIRKAISQATGMIEKRKQFDKEHGKRDD